MNPHFILKSPPTAHHLSRLYYELQEIGASCVGKDNGWPYGKLKVLELLVLAAEMLRYDPRLMTILVQYCIEHFWDINPSILRNYYQKMQMPQIWAVIAEFIKVATDDKETIYWAEYLQCGLKPVPLQFFYHYIYLPGTHLSQRAIETGLVEYKKWGFLACERPTIDNHTKKTAGSLDRKSRLNLLMRLIAEKKEIQLSDYIRALNHAISRQQALLDLRSSKHLVHEGHGRGARWHLAA